MKMTRAKALKIRSLAMDSAVEMDDINASSLPEMFPKLKEDGELVKVGTRINWNGQLKKAAVDLWDTAENNPDNAPALWEDLNYVNGYRAIPEVITVTTAFAKGEIGFWKDSLYESLFDANVYNPEQFAAGWKKVE
jgi:hypothetical protein